LSRASAAELVRELRDPNPTWRALASDQLVDRLGKQTVPTLKRALKNKPTPTQKVQVLWALYRLGGIEEAMFAEAAKDASRDVRTHAMRIFTETAELSSTSRKLVIAALQDKEAIVQRCAAEALAAHPAAENIEPLLAFRESVSPRDTHLFYVARKALRDQLVVPGTLAALKLNEQQQKFIADVAVAVRTEDAGAWLVKYMQRATVSREQSINYLRHATRYAPESEMDLIADVARSKVASDLDLQLELFKSVQEGAGQRGKPLSGRCRAWGKDLAQELLASSDPEALEWHNTPLPGMPDPKNPWFVQKRVSADGDKNSRFLCSLPPGGERLTGILRSKPFTVPAHLKFFLAGHDGFPGKPAQKKNVVRLRLEGSSEIIAEIYPPRNDTAQAVEWDLGAHHGKKAALEVTDADSGDAYAWLAIGRFDPPVVKVPAIDPSQTARRQKSAAELAAALSISSLQPRLESLLLNPSTELEPKAAIAQTLVTFKPNDQLAGLASQIADAGLSDSLREQIIRAIAGKTSVSEALTNTLRLASHRVQQKLAHALAGSTSGAEFLLQAAADGQISRALLLDRSTKEKVLVAKIPDAATRVAKLTEGISAPNEALQKLIEKRRKKFSSAAGDTAEGARLFTQNCAVCHQIGGSGSLIGPQLDGIANRGVERICEDILDPNRNVDPAFRSTLLVLKDGDVASGLFRREEGETIVLAESTGKEISIPKQNVGERRQSDSSLMPENFGEVLSEDQFNNLLAFLLSQSSGNHGAN
jgi:putative heme-binding domain-containing protein